MTAVRGVLTVARTELRLQLRSWVTLVLASFLVMSASIYALNPEYPALIGAADLPRNAAYVIYSATSDVGFWLIFFLAHVMTVPITRDATAHMAEVAYSLPGGLRAYLVGKWLGALATGLVIAAFISISWAVVPAVLRVVTGDARSFVPTPWLQLGHAYLLFLVPTVVGLGTLYFWTAARTGRTGIAYGLSFVTVVIWMVAILVLRRNDLHREASEWLDPIGYNSVMTQLAYWTTSQRLSGTMSLEGPFVVNRVGLLAIGGLSAIAAFARPSLERLLLGPRSASRRRVREREDIAPGLRAVGSRVAVRARGWQARAVLRLGGQLWWQSLRSPQLIMMLLFGGTIMVASIFFTAADGIAGPQRMWVGVAAPGAEEFWYMPAAIFLCFAAGQWVTRERDANLWQITDATPIATAALALIRIVAVALLAIVLALVPTVVTLVVQIVFDRDTIALGPALFYGLAVDAPAYLQVAALALVSYALVPQRWLAHFLAFATVFVCTLNHKLEVLSHSALQLAMPLHLSYSPLTGLAPWWSSAVWLDGWLLAVAAALAFVAAILWPRGADPDLGVRVRAVSRTWTRLRTGAGIAIAVTGALCLVQTVHAIDRDNGYRSPATLRADAARYERTVRHAGPRVTPGDGTLTVAIDLPARAATVTLDLAITNREAVAIESIDFDVPERMHLTAAAADGVPPAQWRRGGALRHDTLALAAAIAPGATAQLHLTGTVDWPSFGNEGRVPRITASGAWLRGEDLVPRLGYDRRRELRALGQRRELGLSARDALPETTLAQAYGIQAAPGTLVVDVTADPRLDLIVSGAPTGHGRVAGRVRGSERLAIALAAYAPAPLVTMGPIAIQAFCAPERLAIASAHAEAAARALTELGTRYGATTIDRLRIVEVPRNLGGAELAGDVLAIPEELSWDNTAANPATVYVVARLLARHWWIDRLQPVAARGYPVFGEAFPIAAGLVVLEAVSGARTRAGAADRLGDRALRALAEAREPVVPLAEADDAVYVAPLGGLAIVRDRADADPAATDARWRAALSRGPGATLAAWISAAALGEIRAWTIRVTTAERDPTGTLRVTLDAREHRYRDGGWVDVTPDARVAVSVLDRDGTEVAHGVAALASVIEVRDVPVTAATVVVDPERLLLDRNVGQDRFGVRRAAITSAASPRPDP